MLGHRGCRLGITYPEIYGCRCARSSRRRARSPGRACSIHPEIMIPLIAHVRELERLRVLVDQEIAAVLAEHPRARVPSVDRHDDRGAARRPHRRRDREARRLLLVRHQRPHADGLRLSRDDAGKFLPDYVESGILPDDPFVVHRRGGHRAADGDRRGRRPRGRIRTSRSASAASTAATRRASRFCAKIGLDYVSCSPFRVPVARLAAAQAAAEEAETKRPRRKRR